MIFYPPMNIATRDRSKPSVFFAGTIDQGNSADWQSQLANTALFMKYNIFNPRRPNWDSSWDNDFENPHFFQQVNWELEAINQADIVIFYFAKDSKSPISLMELGYVVGIKKKCICVCYSGFYRRGNIEVLCSKENIPLYYDLLSMLKNHPKHSNTGELV